LAGALSDEGLIANAIGLIKTLDARAQAGLAAVLQALPPRLL
jgi:hypothetical protein